MLIAPALAFICIYSAQPHKEWRFIVYVVPQMTLAAATGASYVFNHRRRIIVLQLLNTIFLCSIAGTMVLSVGMLVISRQNYPGGIAIAAIPDNARSYLDVYTCMTGASRFLQSGGNFTKTEAPELLKDPAFWESLDYASVQDPKSIQKVYADKDATSAWQVDKEIDGFAGLASRSEMLTWPPKFTKSKTQLLLMRNHHRPDVLDLNKQRAKKLYDEVQAEQEKHANIVDGKEEAPDVTRTWYEVAWSIFKQVLIFI